MFATRLLLAFGIFCISSVVYGKTVCDFEDSKCLTESANLKYVEFIKGTRGVESSDPLHVDLVEANLPTINYKLIGGNVSGMTNCKLELVKIYPKDLKFDYNIGCPHLTLDSDYEIKGEIDSKFIEGKGKCKIDLYDYHFLFHGDYSAREGEGGKIYLNMKTHELKIEAKGKVHYDFQGLYNGDKEKSDAGNKFANDNWELFDKTTRQPAWEAYLNTKYIENVNAYLDIVDAHDLFSY